MKVEFQNLLKFLTGRLQMHGSNRSSAITSQSSDETQDRTIQMPVLGTTDKTWASLEHAIPDYYIFKDAKDGNKIKARNGSTGVTVFPHASNADITLQSCFDSLTGGGTIMAGVGSFDLFAQPATSNVVNLIGSGIGRTNFVRKLTTGYSTISLSAPNITISDFTIDGNYPTNSSAVGTSANELDIHGNNVQCKNIEVKNFAGQAGIFNTGQYVNISNCQITGVNSSGKSSWGILTYPLPMDPITTIRDCHISYCDLNAICVNGYTTIEHCNFENNCRLNGGHIWGGGGIDGAIVTRVANCDFKGSLGGASGIEANNGQWIMIGNTITGLIYGIIILESTGLGEIYAPTIASNNVIKNCSFVGIDLIDATRYTIINGNICFDDQTTHTQTRGIFTQGTSNNYVLTNNICFGNTNSQVSDTASGTNKLVANNLSA